MNNYINANVITNQKKIKANVMTAQSATTERAGLIRIATQNEAELGIDNSLAITPLTLKLVGDERYANTLELSLDEQTYILTVTLKSPNGTILSTDTVDFPNEYAIESVDYDPLTKELIFTLKNGNTFKTAITGLQAEITNDNKLSSDLVNDNNNNNKFVTVNQKSLLDNITATANEINILDGATIDVTELNSLDNITDNVQTQLNGISNDLSLHTLDKTNPHEVTKTQLGLSNVDNTSDLDKPISTATQTALDNKVDKLLTKPTAGTYTKITINNEGQVTDGETLQASDIPNLTLNKITDITASATELNYVDGVTSNVQTQIDNKLDKKPDNINNLIDNNKISLVYVPDILLGQMLYAGTFNSATATATLSTNAKTKLGTSDNTIILTNDTTAITGYQANEGCYYLCSNDGTFASISFLTGDWLLSTGSGWTKIDNTDAVTGVKGDAESSYRIGNINITADNVLPEQANNNGKFLKTNGTTVGWGSAVVSITTGNANGTISVDGTDVSVYGLGSAAYTSSSDYATSAQGAKADTAVQPSAIANMQTTTNLVTSVSSLSTDSQYPSAKLFYDTCGDIETLINAL